MDNKIKLESVQGFIFDDEVQNILSKINDNVMDFNILEITGMGNQEIKHSNILGWLFDDTEHNLEYQILDNFLKKVIKKNSNHQLKSLQEYLYLSSNKRNITIYREKDNIDLLIVDESNKIVITIENKVYADERTELTNCDGEELGQLDCYEKRINEKYKDYNKYFIFLTINLEKPTKENWLKANHRMVTNVIENVLKIKEVTSKTKIVLESYVDLLKRNGIVEDKELKNLCEKIWHNKKYANALDILMDYRVSQIKIIYDKLKEKINFYDNSTCIELEGIKKLYTLIGKKWEDSEEVIFEIVCEYNKGKDENIWLGFWHPDLLNQEDDIQQICRKMQNKKTKKYERILLIDKKYIDKKDIDTVVGEIINKINQVDIKIINILNEQSK
jgi:hypothetical protein